MTLANGDRMPMTDNVKMMTTCVEIKFLRRPTLRDCVCSMAWRLTESTWSFAIARRGPNGLFSKKETTPDLAMVTSRVDGVKAARAFTG